MNAGRDVERLIASWLVDEAAAGAPDRVLESTRQVVHRTNQRRFAATWRETMSSPVRSIAMAATLVVALVGGVFIGRATAPPGVGAPPVTTTPGPSASAAPVTGPSIEDYRAARNAICAKYKAQVDPHKAKLFRIYDPELPAADRAIEVQALTDIATLGQAMAAELAGLAAPSSLAAAHDADVVRWVQIMSLIRQQLPLIQEGDYNAAEALDLATNPLSRAIEAYERSNALDACP